MISLFKRKIINAIHKIKFHRSIGIMEIDIENIIHREVFGFLDMNSLEKTIKNEMNNKYGVKIKKVESHTDDNTEYVLVNFDNNHQFKVDITNNIF